MTRARHIATVWHKPLSTVGIMLFFLGLGLGLVLQPTRWSATPAYGNLLDVYTANTWGLLFITTSILLMLSLVLHARIGKAISVIAHMASFILTISWTAAFIIRWATDEKTTVMNMLAWSLLLLGMVIRSYIVMDDYTERSNAPQVAV